MQVASLELSKTLFELSGWDDTHEHWHDLKSNPMVSSFTGDRWQAVHINKADILGVHYPAYDLGYLLRKLPRSIENDGMHQVLQMLPGSFLETYKFRYITNDNSRVQVFAFEQDDTLEDAACNLAIELFKQGVLKRD